MKKNICVTLSFLMLASCMTQPAAPIEYGSSENRKSGYSEHTKSGLSDENEGSIKSRQIEGKKIATPTGEMREKDEPFTEYKEVDTFQEEKPLTRQEMAKEENKLENDLAKEDKKLRSLEEEMDEMESQDKEANPAEKISKEEEVVRPDKVKDGNGADENMADKSLGNLKFSMPVSGKIIIKFGDDIGGKKSNGINISAARGSGVKSIAEGRVVFAGTDPKFGNLVIIKVGSTDMFAAYAYMDDLMLQKDDDVSKGQVIGHVGATGEVSVPQLHFALRKGKTPVDPMGYLTTGR